MPFKFVQSIFLPHNSQSVGARCIARMTKYHVATENAANPMMRYVIIIIFAVVICFCFAGRMRNVSCISGRLSQIYSKPIAPIKNLSKLTLKSTSLFHCVAVRFGWQTGVLRRIRIFFGPVVRLNFRVRFLALPFALGRCMAKLLSDEAPHNGGKH